MTFPLPALSIGLIGPGLIGKTLLRQIQRVTEQLKSVHQITFNVHVIMNSKHMLLSDTPIDLSTWEEQLNACDTKADLNLFAHHMRAANTTPSVIIDCTENKKIAQEYVGFLEKGIHIITPNKQANAGDFNDYKQLKNLTNNGKLHY